MPTREFRKLPRSLLRTARDQRLFESVWKEIAVQVEDQPYVVNLDRLARVPDEAQTVYWLWLFGAEVGCNGLEDFVLQGLGIYAPQIHRALKAVGSHELLHRLEAAIPIALSHGGSAEFTRLPDQVWFRQFAPVAEYPTLQSIDKGIHPIVDSVTDAVVAFIKLNDSILFQPDDWDSRESHSE